MKLSSAHQDLATDDSPRVRHTVASGYHEVVRLLGDKSMSAVGIYQKLLNSKSVEVRQSFSSLLSLIASIIQWNSSLRTCILYSSFFQPTLH